MPPRTVLESHGRSLGRLALLLVAGTLSAGVGLALLLPLLAAVGVGAQDDRLAGFFRTLGVTPRLGPMLALFVAVTAVQALAERARTVRTTDFAQEVAVALQGRLYAALERARWEMLLEARSSDLLHGATVDLRRVGAAAHTLPSLLGTMLTGALYLGAAAWIAPALTALSAVVGGALALALRHHARRAWRTGVALGQRSLEQSADLGQYLDGFKVARCYGAGSRHRERLLASSRQVADLHREATVHHARGQAEFRLASAGVLALLVYAAVTWLRLPPAELLAMLYVFSRVVPLFSQAEQQVSRLAGDLPAWVGLEALVARLEAAAEPPSGEGPPLAVEREVRLEAVTYRYPHGGGRGVQSVDLVLPAGRVTALMGPSGAGKTTVTDLVLGLLEPQEGRVLVDGQPLDRERWRRSVGYVSQETWLFHDTLRANLLWSRPDASEEALWEALDRAAAGFVRDLPQGLDTVVGDRGVRLSGGERQRVALARAFLRRPSLLVLDEPTSALDEESEARVMEVVEGLKGQVTILLVTHRPSSARRADRVYRLEEGRVC